ncbi:MAG TPA: hypothetical protein VD996_06775 [Chitinophagaceae bacterium]|nr:hypothetical protein [Chitinophagaceae bacterium]
MLRLLIILASCFLCCQVLKAQDPKEKKPVSNLRQKWVPVRADTVRLDSFSIVPSTVSVLGVPASSFELDAINATLTWKQKPALDSVWVTYRVFPGRLNAVSNRFNYDSISNYFLVKPSEIQGFDAQPSNFFNFGNITYNGSFGRGISFGNAQDAVVTSNLNLQLSGYLADSIEIAAAITDNNIPIQPDGTTQQLNEFDRIFLQFKKNRWQLSLGDIDIRENQQYFLNFYKRLQGAAFEFTQNISPGTTNRTLVSGSIAKGKFTRNIFQGQEGNQGPYRLQGANNEFFFVVLAGTERVYLDGELLQRGEDRDYVINYNTAELTFTPNRMITKDRRIQVEFEYADRNFLNVNLYAYNETNFNNKLKLKIGAFNNSDAKNSPINQTLDPLQKSFLNVIGDSVHRAFYPVSTIDTFSAGKILYKQIDTTYGSNTSTIYVYSTHPDSAKYSLSFIDVGFGNGNYLPDFNGANGKVYRWIEPVNGQPQGQFEPAMLLVTPKKQQLVNLGLDYNLSKRTFIGTEVAMSNYDVNTFSERDKGNDKGFAAKFVFRNTTPVGRSKQLITDAGYEFVEAKFRPLERLRNVEFTRDWGLPFIVQPANEHIYTGGLQFADGKQNSIRYQIMGYIRGDDFTGIRNVVHHRQAFRNWQFNNQFNISNMSTGTDKGYFLRPNINITRLFPKLGKYSLAFNYALEHNELRNKRNDTVSMLSFSFQTIQLALRSDESKPNKWGITYFTRSDKYPFGKELIKGDQSRNVNVFAELLKSARHQFRINATYRNLEVVRPDVARQKADNSLLARAEYQVNEWKGLLTGNVLYEVGSGQEQKRDFAFLEVPAGQGEYTWIDYNNDGVQQLNEFEIAVFQDQAKYIRIFTPTNEFIKANYNTFNYSVGLNPRAYINLATAGSFAKFIAKFNLQSSLQISKKEISTGIVEFNPFKNALNDTSLIALNEVYVNTFSYNRFSSKWGIDLNNVRNSGKALLTYGYESRKLNEWSVRGRVNFSRTVGVELVARTGENTLATSNAKFDNRNYEIDQYSLEPRLNITRGSVFRMITGYRFQNKQNKLGNQEKYSAHSLNQEIKYNILQTTSIQVKFTYTNILYQSKDVNPGLNSTVNYILLDGLLPGKNFLWNLDLTKRLSNSLELNIQYEGRKPGSARVVHIGRTSLRALL